MNEGEWVSIGVSGGKMPEECPCRLVLCNNAASKGEPLWSFVGIGYRYRKDPFNGSTGGIHRANANQQGRGQAFKIKGGRGAQDAIGIQGEEFVVHGNRGFTG